MKCPRHPDVETELRCGKCEQPICPKCTIQTPVGVRCPKCAALRRLPIYEVPVIFYLRAILAGLASAAALGAIWAFIPWAGFFLFFITIVIGYIVGEVVSLSVNRKRGLGLQIIAGMSVVSSYVVKSAIEAPPHRFLDEFVNMFGLISLAIGVIVAVSLLRGN